MFATYDELPKAIEGRFGGISDTVEFSFEGDTDPAQAKSIIERVHQIGSRFEAHTNHYG